MADQAATGWTPPRKPEEWLVYLVGGASALYILCCLPSFLGPGSIAGALFLILFGALLTLAGILAAVAALFYAVTKKDAPKSSTRAAPVSSTHRDTSTTEARQQLYDAVVEEMLQSAGSSAPPHGFLAQGRFSGWVWTIPSSKYDKAQALVNWPPATEGPKAVATKWWGSLRGSTLYLARTSGIESSYLVPVSEMDLSDCRVEVLTQGLKSKSRWWRKCPLQISHPERTLLHKETSVALFAEGSAAKEQWYAALKQASGAAELRQGVEDLYSRFCEHIRGNEDVDYPQVGDEGEWDLSAESATRFGQQLDKDAGTQPQARRWGRWWSRRRGSPSKLRPAPLPTRISLGASPPKKLAAVSSSGFVNPMEVEQAWMGRSTGAGHLAKPAKALEPRNCGPPGSSSPGISQASHAGTMEDAADSKSQPLPASPSAPELPSKDAETKAAKFKERKSVQLPVELPRAESSGQGSPVAATPIAGGSPSSSSLRGEERANGSHGTSVPRVPVEHGVNMLLARVAFDVLRNPAVRTTLKANIQRKLNELRIPDFMHGIEVVDIDIGDGVPAIHNLYAMPTPSSTIWPQVRFDLDYEGDITVVIETKLDVRDGAAWSQLDKAISRFAGPEDPNKAEDPGQEGSSMDVLSPEDSDDDNDDSGALSPTEAAEDGGKRSGQRRGLMANMMALRQRTAQGFRQLAEVTADHLSRMQLRLRLEITALKGPMYVWVPPPPGDRLWFSFVTAPQLVASATPLVGGRLLKYSYQAGRVSQWIASKLQSSVAKNMVFPSCSDIPLPFLLGIDHPDMASVPPTFLSQGDPSRVGAAAGGSGRRRSMSKTDKSSVAGTSNSSAEAAASIHAQATVRSPDTLETPRLPAPINTGSALAEPTAERPASVCISSSPASRAPAGKPAGKAVDSPKSSKGFWGGRQQQLPPTAEKAPTAGLAKAVPHRADIVQHSEASQESVQPRLLSDAQASAGHVNGVEMSDMQAVKGTDATPLNEDIKGRVELSDSQGDGMAGSKAASPCSSDEAGQAVEMQDGVAEDVSARVASHSQLVTDDSREANAADKSDLLLQDMPLEGGSKKVDHRKDVDVLHNTSEANAGSPNCDVAEDDATTSAEAGAAESRKPAVEGQTTAAGKRVPASAAVHPLAMVQTMPEAETLGEVSPAVSGSVGGTAKEQPGQPSVLTVETGDMSPGPSPSESKTGSSTSELASLPDPLQAMHYSSLDRASFASAGASPTMSARLLSVGPSGAPSGSAACSDAGNSSGQAQQLPDSPFKAEEAGSERERQERAAKWGLPANMQKNWEMFKSRNPKIAANTMQQGKKLAGAMEKLREQAQEQVRRAQDQMRVKQEQKRREQQGRPTAIEGPAKAHSKDA